MPNQVFSLQTRALAQGPGQGPRKPCSYKPCADALAGMTRVKNRALARSPGPGLSGISCNRKVKIHHHNIHLIAPEQNKIEKIPAVQRPTSFAQTYFHGTKADLKIGDLIEVGFNSNYGQKKNAKYIFLTATLDAAIWGAELATGEGRERIYLVEPTGAIEDDPDLTDKKFPGNPTKSYRSTQPFNVVGEVTIWQGHPDEQVTAMKKHLEQLKEQGINSLND